MMSLQVIPSSICVLLVITAMVFPAVTLLAGRGPGRVLCTHIEPPREQVARVTACLVLLVHTVTAQVRHTASHTAAHKALALQGNVHTGAQKLICASLFFYISDSSTKMICLTSASHTFAFHLRAHISSLNGSTLFP